MRGRLLLIILLVANAVLALGWILAERRQARLFSRVISTAPVITQTKTNVSIRRQFFTWQQVESEDYLTYVANLRVIGCPEQTIRDIIIADVNAVYARKKALEVVTPEQQWWRPEPDTNLTVAAATRLEQLETERRALLTSLLGGNWESGDQISLPRPSRPGVNLDGAVLGALPNDVKQMIQEINARATDRSEAYVAAQQRAGKPVDEAELARLRQQTRTELAQVLSPQQLEEFLLRYSQSANNLRANLGQLKYFNASADEFRSMFKALDPINQQLEALGDNPDAQSASQRTALYAQAENALKLALGKDRFELYRRLQDAGYRDAYAAAQNGGVPEAAGTLFDINQATTDEQNRIRANTNLSAQQLALELKKAEIEQLKATLQALGQEVPPDPTPPPKPPPVKTHVLSNGENLDFLARLYGVNPDQLRAANPDLNLNNLKAGDSVKVPISILPPVPALPPGN